MFEGTFEGHFTGLTDTHEGTDPWGLGITVDVLRADHPDALAWDKAHPNSGSEIGKEFGQRGRRETFRAQLQGGVRAGLRQKKKLTKAQLEAAEAKAEEEPEISEADVQSAMAMIDRTIDAIPQEAIDAMYEKNMNDSKPKVAAVLLRGWSGVNEPGDIPIPFNLRNALRFVGWEGLLLEEPDKEPQFLVRLNPPITINYPAPLVATEFFGNPRKPDGSLWICPKGASKPGRQEFGPSPAGDAITAWLLTESLEGTLVKAKALEESSDFLAPTPDGKLDTLETVQ